MLNNDYYQMNMKIEKANKWNTFRDRRAEAITSYLKAKKYELQRNQFYYVFTVFRYLKQIQEEVKKEKHKLLQKRMGIFIVICMSNKRRFL